MKKQAVCVRERGREECRGQAQYLNGPRTLGRNGRIGRSCRPPDDVGRAFLECLESHVILAR